MVFNSSRCMIESLIQLSVGNVFLRYEIRDLEENHPDQWNLYLLALQSLQDTSQDDAYSYYGLASMSVTQQRIRQIFTSHRYPW